MKIFENISFADFNYYDKNFPPKLKQDLEREGGLLKLIRRTLEVNNEGYVMRKELASLKQLIRRFHPDKNCTKEAATKAAEFITLLNLFNENQSVYEEELEVEFTTFEARPSSESKPNNWHRDAPPRTMDSGTTSPTGVTTTPGAVETNPKAGVAKAGTIPAIKNGEIRITTAKHMECPSPTKYRSECRQRR
jgi:hypothetical protein